MIQGWRHSVLDPAGPQAGRIHALWWFLFAVSVIVFVLVVGAMLTALVRSHRRDVVAADSASDRRAARVVAGAVGATAVILLVFLAFSVRTGRAIGTLPSGDVLTIELTGHQWWWEAEYVDTNPSLRFTTANEIHVPVGRAVQFDLVARDVIHSFWVPSLHGKKDMIPGQRSRTWFRADTAGVYRGQCAEFCGHQHAKMGLLIIAEPEEQFAAWYASQLRPAVPPRDSLTRRGQQVFLGATCAMCHTINGTNAASRVGPPLTHVGSQRTIAAATLPNTRGHLAGWILDPQRIKPGVRMPPNQLSADDLQALLAYLESLK